jgi:hypothetical protein
MQIKPTIYGFVATNKFLKMDVVIYLYMFLKIIIDILPLFYIFKNYLIIKYKLEIFLFLYKNQ